MASVVKRSFPRETSKKHITVHIWFPFLRVWWYACTAFLPRLQRVRTRLHLSASFHSLIQAKPPGSSLRSSLWRDTLWHWLLHVPCNICYVQLNYEMQKVSWPLAGNKISDLSFVWGIGLLVPGWGGRVYGGHLLRRWLGNTHSPRGPSDLLLLSLPVTQPTSLILRLKKVSLPVLKGSLWFRSPQRNVLEILLFY